MTDAAVLKQWAGTRPWIRIRRLPDPSNPQRAQDVIPEREALRQLKEMGFKPVPFVRWPSASWTHGVRAGGRQRLPLDLREAYERAKRIAETYGDVVAGLEFENEPDINFVDENAETYAAFHKACYLGVRAADVGASVEWVRTLTGAGGGISLPVVNPGRRPLAIMAPLALPPGPFFEQLVENRFFDYTDVFNYHYYGHADDFSAVYRQFEDAMRPLGRRSVEKPEPKAKTRRLPVMLTEYGFSGVSGPERYGAEVRVEQWRWFRQVGEQIRELRIAAPMAFYLPPYYERKQIEFGMTVRPPKGGEAEDGGGENVAAEKLKAETRSAGGLVFRPEDFGAEKVEPWMERIGAKVGGNEALPALAWLWDAAERQPYRPRDWEIAAAEVSPIVIDVIAGAGLVELKRYSGYMLSRAEGTGELAIYNFSENEIRGKLRWETGEGTRIMLGINETITVSPRSRVVVPFTVVCGSTVLAGTKVKAVFEPSEQGVAAAVLATHVYPWTDGMTAQVLERFDHTGEAASRNREILVTRPRASDERRLTAAGRWLTSVHARVEESSATRWRLVGSEFKRGPKVGRATFELPLRDTFVFPEQSALRMSYRLAAAEGKDAESEESVFLEVYLRTENGNLFVVWPWLTATSRWGGYLEMKANYTMMFQSRANLPWRFAENRPVALVFSFYSPTMEGAVVEIDRPEIVQIGR